MQSKLMSLFILALSTATAHGVFIQFYPIHSCSGADSFEFRDVDCNKCFTPPGDWNAARVTDISSTQRVSIHNKAACNIASSVGQFYGPACRVAGNSPIRSVYVACSGFKQANGTETSETDVVPTIIADDA